jgi:hypothetical protein
MAELRGRPLAYLSLGLAAWVGGRIYWSQPGGANVSVATVVPAKVAEPTQTRVRTNNSMLSVALMPKRGALRKAAPLSKTSGFTPALDPWQDGGRPSGLLAPPRVAESGKPLSTGRDTPPTIALAPAGKAGPHQLKRRWGGEVYAYSFWRISTGGGPALAPGAQYGGSQSGVVATLDPFGQPDTGLQLLARAAATPDWDEREVALGLRWKPDADWPFLLSAERRFRGNAPDSFAAYLSGGVDALSLTGKWQLDAYGQAGYATGTNGGGFFDGQARVTRPLADVASMPLSIGVGGWTGGQRESKRLDLGPTAVARLDAGPTTVLIQLDWRLRAAGNAEPKDGVALTLSTGF